jgi:adenosylhomocysteine nucleosidase
MNRVVVLISADAEWRALRQILAGQPLHLFATPFGEAFEYPIAGFSPIFMRSGWGKISAAASAQYALDHLGADFLFNLGTCGGLDGRIERGAILLVERALVYDIIEQMGDPQEALEHYATNFDLSWLDAFALPPGVQRGLMVSADRDILREEVPLLIDRFGAVAGDWESGAIAWVAARNQIPCLILRGVTDLVSPQQGEVYGDLNLYQQRTLAVMQRLLEILPVFLRYRSGQGVSQKTG